MTEQARTTLFGILKLIPFAIVTAIIVLLWVDDFLCFMLSFFCFWITLPAIVLSIVFFIMGLRWRDIWQRIAVVWGGLNLLMLILYFLVQEPNQQCNPDIMAAHYEEHHTEMEALREYLHEALNDSCAIELFFEGNQLERFYVGNRYGSDHYYNGEAQSRLDSMMAVAGLSQEEYANIRQRLESIQCNGVEYDQYDSTGIFIRFRCDEWGCYGYSIRTRPVTDKQKETIMKDNRFIPYDEYCSFVYDGSAGAFDSGGFCESEKRRFLKKHKPW